MFFFIFKKVIFLNFDCFIRLCTHKQLFV
jgi:hypothetical protein